MIHVLAIITAKPGMREEVLGHFRANMAAVQQGMKNAGFRGAQVNPYMERSIASLHFNLSRYMGTGAPMVRD